MMFYVQCKGLDPDFFFQNGVGVRWKKKEGEEEKEGGEFFFGNV